MRFLAIACLMLFSSVSANAQTWVRVPPTTTRNFYDCWFDPANPEHGALTGWYTVAGDQYSFVYSTDDGGATLVPQDVFMGGMFLAAQSITYTSSLTGYVAGTGVLKTYDGGLHWNSILDFGMVQGKLTDIYFASPDSGYTVGEGWYGPTAMFFKTTNAGMTWTQHDPPTQSTQLTCLARPSRHALYVGARNSGGRTLYKSTNDGDSWLTVSTYSDILSLDFFSDLVGYAGTAGGILRTTDGGITWTTVLNASGDVNNIKILGGTGFAVTSTGSIYQTIDGGLSWTQQPSPVQGTEILRDVCVLSHQFAYAVGSHGTILKYGSPASVPGRTAAEGAPVVLLPSSPNPFTTNTKIRYRISEQGPVSLHLYDAQGRVAKNLLDRSQEAGWHEVEVKGGELEGGVYYYKLTANGTSAEGKVLRVR